MSSRRPLWQRILRAMVLWGVALAVLGAIFLGTAVFITERQLPDFSSLKSSQNGQMIVVRASDGSELVSLGPSYGKWLSFNDIPPIMREAMVSVEDRRFYSHPGIDPYGLARAVFVGLVEDKRFAATSTITQQLARNIFLNNNRSYTRKAREMVLALALERKFTKDQILELYLNKVYFGGGAYGIDAASRKFFGHPGTTLSVGEAAIIAGLVKAPSNYSPTADIDASIRRGKVVLGTMAENGVISRHEADTLDLSKVKVVKDRNQNSVRYFTDWALPQLETLLPDNNEPIEVWTTLDPKLQKAATKAIDARVPKGAQGALVSMDNNGAILAMVGGTDYVTSNYNRAVSAVRQPGSSWKLFVYMAALEAGYTPDEKILDGPVTIDGWSPHNDDNRYSGMIDVRSAFAYSKNTIAAKLGNDVGFGTVAAMARRFGITTPINTQPAMVLGTSEVHVIDMTRAFAEVSAGGTSVEPYGITKVTTTGGKVLYQHQATQGQVLIPPYVDAGITDLLQSAVATGTGRAANIGRPVAGKTGTTTSNRDGWFLGFSSGVTTGVWMGRDDAKPVRGLWGGTGPARAFSDYMKVAVANRPVQQFQTQLQLPQWQLEPDQQNLQGDPNDYQYTDENGNPVYGDGQGGGQQGQYGPDGQMQYEDGTGGGSGPGNPPYGQGQQQPPTAVGPDFLDRATGRTGAAHSGSGQAQVAPRPVIIRPQAPPAPPVSRRTSGSTSGSTQGTGDANGYNDGY